MDLLRAARQIERLEIERLEATAMYLEPAEK
jgi:hypothetical protein